MVGAFGATVSTNMFTVVESVLVLPATSVADAFSE
jgi:hypothetical protein